jgi:DNA-binding MarR family transcriptional regulator
MGSGGTFDEREYRERAEFYRALYEFLRRADERARNQGLTSQQFVLMLAVRGHQNYPAVSISDISGSLKLQQSSTSLLVDRCVKRGLVWRSEDPVDRRRALVRLSESGQTLLDDIMEANRRDLGRLESSLFNAALHDVISPDPGGISA